MQKILLFFPQPARIPRLSGDGKATKRTASIKQEMIMRPKYLPRDLRHFRTDPEPLGDSAVMWAVALVIFLIIIGMIQ